MEKADNMKATATEALKTMGIADVADVQITVAAHTAKKEVACDAYWVRPAGVQTWHGQSGQRTSVPGEDSPCVRSRSHGS